MPFRAFLSSASALLVAVAAAGQAPEPARLPGDSIAYELPGIEVNASILSSVGPIVGSGVPARVAILSGPSVTAWSPRLLANALSSQAGVSLYDDLGSPFRPTLVTRGFSASGVVGLPQGVSVFLDGVPVNEPDARQVNFDLLPLEHVRRVEMLSGTASLLGPNSLGGSVNLVTRHNAGETESEIEASVGSFGAYSLDGFLSGGAGRLDFYLGSGYEQEGGWRESSSGERYHGFLNLGRSGPDEGWNVQAFVAKSYAETAGSLPFSVYRSQPERNLTAGDFEDLDQIHVSLTRFSRIGAGRGSLNVYFRSHNAERFNVNQEADPDVRAFSANRTLGATSEWSSTANHSWGTIETRVGADASVNRSRVRMFGERIDPGLTTDIRSPISGGAAFALVNITRSRLNFTAGLRADAVRIPFRNLIESDRDTTSVFVELNPRAGLAFELTDNASVYASLGRSFRPPALIELACADPEEPCPLPFALGDDPPLDPVRALTYEVGSRWIQGGANLSASLYRTDVRNDIFLFPFEEDDEPVGSTIDGFFANIEATRRQGAEVDARYALPTGHSVYANYAFTRATFEVDDIELFSIREAAGAENEIEKGNLLPMVPQHTANVGADLSLPAGIQMGLAGRYVGERFLRGDEANEEETLAGYFLADGRIEYSLSGWTVRLILQNALDTRYAGFGTFNLYQAGGNQLERFLTPGAPRSIRLSLARNLGH